MGCADDVIHSAIETRRERPRAVLYDCQNVKRFLLPVLINWRMKSIASSPRQDSRPNIVFTENSHLLCEIVCVVLLCFDSFTIHSTISGSLSLAHHQQQQHKKRGINAQSEWLKHMNIWWSWWISNKTTSLRQSASGRTEKNENKAGRGRDFDERSHQHNCRVRFFLSHESWLAPWCLHLHF